MTSITLAADKRSQPPPWAVRQRYIITRMNGVADPFVKRCTRHDGTLEFRTPWTGMDGTDNAYETFLSFALFYLVGGGAHVRDLAQTEWETITRQFTAYGTVDREFVAGFDWFHHSESYTYLSYLALADPDHVLNRQRAVRFAAMYIGEDPLAPNWDAERRMIRAPLNGSRGPRFVSSPTEWINHRPILSRYLAPFEDIPGEDASDPLYRVDWMNDETFQKIMKLINERMTHGDVPLNLCATYLVTHAYIHTGEDKYRQWVLDYLHTWMERCNANKGILPDNIGPNGQIGQLMNGKWWGGYYGWRWPHGARNIVESALVAGACALLMTGDFSCLDLARTQMDLLWSLRREEEGVLKVPARHGDQGWFDYRLPDPYHYIHLHYLSQSPDDLARINEVFPDRTDFGKFHENWGSNKSGFCPPTAWFAFNEGKNSSYPDHVAESTEQCIDWAIDRQRADRSDPQEREPEHFQPQNPVVPEALVQMTMGTPAAIYNGGLLQAHLRYFDPQRGRSGLPDHVAALAQDVTATGVRLTLVNTDPMEELAVLIQSGAFAEHEFKEARLENDDGKDERFEVKGKHVHVNLGPVSQVRLHLTMKRYAHRPTYDFPSFSNA